MDLLGPQQIILVTTRAEINYFGKESIKDDIDTVVWHTAISRKEKKYAIVVDKNKFITDLIKKSGIFIVNFMPFGLEKEVAKINSTHGIGVDKFEYVIKKEASHLDAPVVQEAIAHLECHVVETKEYADTVLFIANIINSDNHKECKRLFYSKNSHYTTTNEL